MELIYDKCGTPNEVIWPGVSELKFFKECGPKREIKRQIKEFLKKTNQK